MANEHIDQNRAYSEYFEAVKNFNRANDEYIQTASEIANNRKSAIQKAIEIHINPVLSRLRGIQSASVVAVILSLVFLCVGFNLVGQSTSGSQITWGGLGQGTLLGLGSLGIGILSLIVLLWVSAKINSLNSDVQEAQKKMNSLPTE